MTYLQDILAVPDIELRRATLSDRPALEEMKERSTAALLDPLMTPEQRVELRQITPFDPTLIEDGTYFVAKVNGAIAASGGWTRRSSLYSDSAQGSSAAPLVDPEHGAAGIRAMYTHPDFARKGLGSLMLSTALAAARLAGFRRAQLLATKAGARLYQAAGWRTDEQVLVGTGDRRIVPGYRMSREI